jgi:magnesium transporter
MLMLHTGAAPADPGIANPARPAIVWFDLLAPTPQEITEVEEATGLHVPGRAELSEIESSSRLRVVGDALYLSAALVFRAGVTRIPGTSPVGFVLARNFLITIRYELMTAFTLFAERLATEPCIDGPAIFVGLTDTIIDRMADVLETVGADLDVISQRIFNTQIRQVSRISRPVNEDAGLRAILQRIGRAGDLASRIRDGLLGVGRFIPFASSARAAWFAPDLQRRLDTQRQDMASLADYDAHLINKVQFLLDATIGLIGIEQNNVFKLLTVVSVIGIPPTLVAGMYGMNFKNMPEYDWAWGYQYGLLLIVLSAAIPWALFKLRGWL